MNKILKIKSSTKFMIMAIILIAIFSFAITPVTMQNDTYYTVKVGEHIKNYGVDMKEPFSWHENLIYTYPHWLYDLISYLIYFAFGWEGIYVTTCILSCILGISLFLVTEKLTKNKVVSFIVTIGAMYVLKPYIAARAQLVTFILFTWTIFFIEKFLETRKLRYAIPLIIIPIAIANLHAAVFPFYFVLFLPYIGEYIIANLTDFVIYSKIQIFYYKNRIALLEKRKTEGKKINEAKLEKLREKLKDTTEQNSRIKIRRSQSKPYKIEIKNNKNVKYLILIMIICVFTGLLTPIGDTPYTYLYKTMMGNTTQNINEHLPMTLSENIEAMCMLILFLAILIFTKTKIRLNDLFFLGGLCYLMLATRRQITMFAIVGTVILTRLIVQMFKEYKAETSNFENKITKLIPSLFVIVLVCYISYNLYKPKMNDKFVNSSSYPVEACDFILDNIDVGKARFYNEYNYGSYMLYRGIPVFIDSRADVYDPQFNGLQDDIFGDFIDVSSVAQYYEDVFRKYGVTHVITYKNSKMNMLIKKSNDENYEKLYEDDHFTIWQRLNA